MDRARFANELGTLLSDWGAGDQGDLSRRMQAVMSDLPDAQIEASVTRLRTTGQSWGYHPPDELARRLSRDVVPGIVLPGSTLEAADVLRAARVTPAVFVGNHLSFVDVNVLDGLAAAAGYADVMDKMTVLVGPKVFSLPIRRLASLCFGTIKLPQSSSRASGEAEMPAREVAKLARLTVSAASERQRLGDHLLVFPEGTRSRAAALQRLLPAISRYLDHEGGLLIPFGHWGTEKLVPLDEDHVYPTRVHFKLGRALPLQRLRGACGRDRALLADVVGYLIADLIPPAYRGVYDGSDAARSEARSLARALPE